MTAQRPRILLVEDNARDVRLMQIVLSELDDFPHLLETANDLVSGVARVRAGGVDLVLLDLNLPESQGVATLARFVREAPAVPVIVVTTLADRELAAEAVAKGAQDYLVKGRMHGPLLPHVLRGGMERHRLTAELRALRSPKA